MVIVKMKIFDEEFIKIANELILESLKETTAVIPFDKLENKLKYIGNYSDEGKAKVIENIKRNELMIYSYKYKYETALINAFMLFKLFECKEQARMLIEIMTELYSMGDIAHKLVDASIRYEKSKAKKGKTNRHHDSALRIAMDTWGEYPNASLAGMTEEIHAYLRSKWNDTPTAETIKSWLKKSNLYPDAKPKNRDFKLIINEEG